MKKFPFWGWLGFAIILTAEVLLILQIQQIKIFFTPIVWTGYILFADALLQKIRGESYLTANRKEFVLMLPVSLICWLIFEAYNLHLENWAYINLPENLYIRLLGYIWSFITIFPGIIITYEILVSFNLFNNIKIRKFVISRTTLKWWMVTGALFLVIPVILPSSYSRYLFALVWMGFVFLFDPINAFLGKHSLFNDLKEGKVKHLFSLFLSGIICGFLWEFWNYWAMTKWVYTLPFLQSPKIFEMPLAGFLGFLPFAVECYVMWVLIRFFFKKYRLI